MSRAMPRFLAMARRDSPCSLACCTASQRACWVGVGVRCNWWRTGFPLSPLRFTTLPSIPVPSPLVSSPVVRLQGCQPFPLSLVQVAVEHAIGGLLRFRTGRASRWLRPAEPMRAVAPPENLLPLLPLLGTESTAPRRPAPGHLPGDRRSWGLSAPGSNCRTLHWHFTVLSRATVLFRASLRVSLRQMVSVRDSSSGTGR